MSETVPQLARKLKRTPQAIQQRMRNIPGFIYKYTKMPHHSRIISDKGVAILVNHKAINSKSHFKRERKAADDALISQLRNDLDYSHKREDKSTKQIMALNEQIKRMTLTTTNLYKRYQQSQENLHSEQSKLQHERDNTKLLKFKESAAHNELTDYKNSHPNHHGWIYRLFH